MGRNRQDRAIAAKIASGNAGDQLVLAIDPGAKCGIALLAGDKPLLACEILDPDFETCIEAMQELMRIARREGRTKHDDLEAIVVEDWTFARGLDAVKALASSQRTWFHVARKLDIPAYKFRSADWQSAIGFNGKSEDRKELSRRFAAHEFGDDSLYDSLTENMADACSMGIVWSRVHAVEGDCGSLVTLKKLLMWNRVIVVGLGRSTR